MNTLRQVMNTLTGEVMNTLRQVMNTLTGEVMNTLTSTQARYSRQLVLLTFTRYAKTCSMAGEWPGRGPCSASSDSKW